MTTREDRIAGLVELAAWLEAHPEVPLPYQLTSGYMLIMTHNEADPKAAIAAVARALPGIVEKSTYGADGDATFNISGRVGGIRIDAIADRDGVCQRVVTGTHEVTKTVPDPSVEVPLVEVTETVEDVEWVCGPLLAESKAEVDVQAAYSERLNQLEPSGIPEKASVSA